MRSRKQDLIVDRLTDSIRNTISGDSFRTEVARLSKTDLKILSAREGWKFNWNEESDDLVNEVYKLAITGNPRIIQGLLSFIEPNFVFIKLLENAPFNVGKKKLYEGVAGNLVAFACKTSFQRGFEGHVSLIAKTRLITHYQKTLKAKHIGQGRMIIDPAAATTLVNKYFKDY